MTTSVDKPQLVSGLSSSGETVYGSVVARRSPDEAIQHHSHLRTGLPRPAKRKSAGLATTKLELGSPELVSIGHLGRTFGLKGWVWLNCGADTYIFNCKKVWLKLRGDTEWVLKSAFQVKKQGSKAILFFPDFCDKESATRLNGAVVAIQYNDLEPLPLGTYYWCDLQGLKVINPNGNDLGHVKALIETGANDVLVLEQSGSERLIPFIRQVITRVDLKEGVIVADWDQGF